MDQRLSIITLGVKDLKKSRAFYESLGWKVATEKGAEGIVAFNLQAMALALYPIDEFQKEIGIDVPSQTHAPMTLAYNVASEDEVMETIELARKVGAKILTEPRKVFWGGFSGYFSDPDGFLWEVAYNPFAKLGPNKEFEWA